MKTCQLRLAYIICIGYLYSIIFIGFFVLFVVFQKTHQVAVQVMQKIEQLIQADHYNVDLVRSIGETISQRWTQLMFHVEERMKLVMASTNWFKTAEQVSC